ncbi:MAG TPA: hypothetical protein VG096_01975 [Bryobacteraceae bacterium]|jgi:hypothetical protein|nr:hypothetical protein [Bryobacteraceae bacterium]
MLRVFPAFLLPCAMVLFAADEQAWKGKQIADWTQDEATQVLTDSPWVKTVTPTVHRRSNNGQPGGSRRSGIGIGVPGIGGIGGRRGGYGYPGGGGGGGGYPGGRRNGEDDSGSNQAPTLKLRWESALPIREAELKTRDTNAPTLDEGHYAIAVYGVPVRISNGDPKKLADQYNGNAAIKRDGKKDLKPSSVEVLQRDDGPVVVYLFPRSKEITRQDRRLEFDAKIGVLELNESFFVEDMVFQNKLEL